MGFANPIANILEGRHIVGPCLVASGACLLFVRILQRRLARKPAVQHIGCGRLDELAGQIRSGAMAFLREEYSKMASFVLSMAVILFFLFWKYPVVAESDGVRVAAIFVVVLHSVHSLVGLECLWPQKRTCAQPWLALVGV